MPADLDAQRGNFPQTGKVRWRILGRDGQLAVAVRVVQTHVNARGAHYPMAGYAPSAQCA